MVDSLLRLDRDALREQFRTSQPFRFFHIDDFVEPAFLKRVADSYPSFEEGRAIGREFSGVNERKKLQITDSARFPRPVQELDRLLASPEFLEDITYITGIEGLVADPQLVGGGMHQTGPGGRLDVHVDFNKIKERDLYRRLNILVYLNEEWDDSWGGQIQLWDKDVQVCHHSFAPVFNRCVVFETSEISFHGVTPVHCPPDRVRKSFAAYYYTLQAPEGYTGEEHSTIFRARPDETLRGKVLMPADQLKGKVRRGLSHVKKRVLGASR